MRCGSKVLAAALGCSAVPAAAAQGGYENGNELYASCTSQKIDERGICLGYVIGTVDTYLALQEVGKVGKAICIPKGVLAGELRDVVAKYLADTPGERHFDAESLVWVAVFHAFPCK
jgi:hypothetical protein